MHPLYKEYLQFCGIASDINEHMSIIYDLACKCQKTAEFGVGYGRSTRAFIAALVKTNGSHRSYDIKQLDGVKELFDRAHNANLDAKFYLESTLEVDMDQPIDMLLVDSHHTYKQVKSELELHGNDVTKYIVFHDIVTYGEFGQDSGTLGIRPAIDEWLDSHKEWTILEERLNNNGLLVCVRNS